MADDRFSVPDARALFEHAPCGLVATKEDGTILRTNDTFRQWVGFSELELDARRFQDLLTMGGRIFHQTHWAPLMKMQGSVAEVKLDLLHRDRHTVTMLLNAIRRERAGVTHYEMAMFAVIDRDKYERELLHARRSAEDLLRQKTAAEAALREAQAELSNAYEIAQRRASFAEQMVAIVSHDLRNPLTAIKLASGLLTKGERSDRELTLLGIIDQSTSRAERMVADLLDFTMARVGRGIACTPSSLDLHRLVEQCVGELRIAFPEAILRHRSVGVGNARVDADRLQQAIGNLVGNSVTYGDTTQPISVISCLGEDGISVSVHNWGPVIPDALMSKLFEPMSRGTDANSDIRSVGLGLFIVREIAQAHGGRVLVTSELDTGTTFTLCFPHSESSD